MDRRRAGLVVALLLLFGVAAAATQGPPAYVSTGTAPSGACSGTRVWIDAGGTGIYRCAAGTWALITGSGGGAPGGSGAELQVRATATTFGAYAGTSCPAEQFPASQSTAGAWTCATTATYARMFTGNPGNCIAGYAPRGVNQSGIAEGCFPVVTFVSAIPSSASAPCTIGEFAADATYLYVCHATNTWARAALSTW